MAKGRRKSRYKGRRPSHNDLMVGQIRINRKGFGFIETPHGSYHIAKKHIGPAMNGDKVAVRKERSGSKGPQASVVRVLERAHEAFVGRFESNGVIKVVVPLDDRLAHDFFLDPQDKSFKKLKVHDEDIVYAQITLFPNRKSAGMCTITRKIGEQGDNNLAIEQVIASHDLQTHFSDAVKAEAKALKLDIDEALKDPLRKDIRDRLIITIDPYDARDFDDAVSLKQLDDGSSILGVHIADVSHYVQWNSSIDIAARQRSTSTYLVDRVLPMLPEELSNELCSLKPHEDRLALSVDMKLNKDAEVVDAKFYPSIIHSKHRLSYDAADALLQRDEDQLKAFSSHTDLALEDMLKLLDGLNALAKKRHARRQKLGGIDFESEEAKVVLDKDGFPTGVSVRKPTDATSLIEEAMLAANESVARFLSSNGVASAFRVHEPPMQDALEGLVLILQEFNIGDRELALQLSVGSPFALQDIIARVKGRPEEYLVSQLVLRSMRRAEYLPDDLGHFGLGMDSYCHFTSPIRRYPDLICHRALKAKLAGIEKKDPNIQDQNRLLPELCKHASVMEREADDAARQTQKIKLAQYMEQFIGQAYSGVVTGIDTFGLFVRLDETTAEGLLPIKKLGDEWFDFDHEKKTLQSESSNKRYRLGQRIAVVVDSVDVSAGYVNFALA